METQTTLFTINLRISKQMVKLKVTQSQSLNDLIETLSKVMTQRTISKEKIKSKLEEQLNHIIKKQPLHHAIIDKLQSLLQQSNILKTNESHEPLLNETPFNILQDTTLYKKNTFIKSQKHYQYLNNHLSQTLHKNYQSAQVSFEAVNTQNRNIHPKIMDKTASNTHQNLYLRHRVDENQIFQKKYEAIDKKCQNYICKHIINNQNLPLQPNINQQRLNALGQFQPSQKKIPCFQQNKYSFHNSRPLIRQQDYSLKPNNKHLSFDQNMPYHLSKVTQLATEAKPTQSFHQYKANRYKNHHYLHKEPLSSTHTPIIQHSPKQARSLTKILSQTQVIRPTIRRSNPTVVKFPSSFYAKGQKKFHYISDILR